MSACFGTSDNEFRPFYEGKKYQKRSARDIARNRQNLDNEKKSEQTNPFEMIETEAVPGGNSPAGVNPFEQAGGLPVGGETANPFEMSGSQAVPSASSPQG